MNELGELHVFTSAGDTSAAEAFSAAISARMESQHIGWREAEAMTRKEQPKLAADYAAECTRKAAGIDTIAQKRATKGHEADVQLHALTLKRCGEMGWNSNDSAKYLQARQAIEAEQPKLAEQNRLRIGPSAERFIPIEGEGKP